MIFSDFNILLASKSPRRRQLLDAAGIAHRVIATEVEESWPDDIAADEVAHFLARKKAFAHQSWLINDMDLLIAADSTVVVHGEVLNKPANALEASAMLRKLSGNSHQVITGVCMLSTAQVRSFSIRSTVFFDELSEAEISYYIEQYQPFDKAGSYAIQEWIGLCKVNRIEGDYYNVMGLPVQAIYRELSLWGKETDAK
jgi:septum formation protein